MAWLILAGAIIAEITATTALKLSDGFTHKGWSLAVVAGYAAAFALLGWALKLQMEVGTAYAVWSGAGTAVIAAIGVLFLGETFSLTKIAGIALIIGGVVVLNLAGGTH
ncbi:multidrug efflux SMR transporter [Streptosporangium sp. NPDC051022]|uniref:DMT family transporter n=1 Tax=Streptosporangium sp. NPDC051022 TaxID=3155752 RepID=UPI0034140553